MRHLFIINPAAGSRDQTQRYRRCIEQICKKRGLDYSIRLSAAPGCCRRLAAEAAKSGKAYRIYACGGDGTLNEVVNGVAGYPNVAVTTFAGGSGNDFARMFSQPEAFQDLERLLDSQEAEFDLIAVNGEYSLNICSVGLDARIGLDVANYKRLPFLSGFRAYALSTAVNVVRGVHEHYVVKVAGQTIDGEMTLICVCNGRYYGGGFCPVPQANPADGKLEVLIIRDVSRRKVAQVVGAYKKGQYAQYPELIRHFTTDRVEILCDGPTGINLDGEMRMGQQVDISLSEKKLRFFYPRGLTY